MTIAVCPQLAQGNGDGRGTRQFDLSVVEFLSLLNNPVGMAGVFAWARMGLPRR
jgi:hypothetical protein